jgi:hypothetical protein
LKLALTGLAYFQVENILDDWRDYKLSVPTYGAIILNEDLSKVRTGSNI